MTPTQIFILALFLGGVALLFWLGTRPNRNRSPTPSADFTKSHKVANLGVSGMGVAVRTSYRTPDSFPEELADTSDCLAVHFATAAEGGETRAVNLHVELIPLPKVFGDQMRRRLAELGQTEREHVSDPHRLMHTAGQLLSVGYWVLSEMADADQGTVTGRDLIVQTVKRVRTLRASEQGYWRGRNDQIGQTMSIGWTEADTVAAGFNPSQPNYVFMVLIAVAQEMARIASDHSSGTVKVDISDFKMSTKSATGQGLHTEFVGPRGRPAAAHQLGPAPEPVPNETWEEDADTDPGRAEFERATEAGEIGMSGGLAFAFARASRPGGARRRPGLGRRSHLPRTSPGGPVDAVGNPPEEDGSGAA